MNNFLIKKSVCTFFSIFMGNQDQMSSEEEKNFDRERKGVKTKGVLVYIASFLNVILRSRALRFIKLVFARALVFHALSLHAFTCPHFFPKT